MKETKSIGINFSGYPHSASNFIIDNGALLLIDSLLKTNNDTYFFDYNVPSILSKLAISKEHKHDMDVLVKQILSQSHPESNLLKEFNTLEKIIEQEREYIVRNEIANELIQFNKHYDADFVWMKLWTGDGFRYSIALAEELKKEFPNLLIVGGGHHVRLFREKTFEISQDAFDILSYAEGEKILPMIAKLSKNLEKIEKIPGCLYKNENGLLIDTKGNYLSSVAELQTHIYPSDYKTHYKKYYENFDEKIQIGMLELSRGCPHNHPYCQHTSNCGEMYRLIDIDVVLKNLLHLNNNGIFAHRIPDSNPPKKQQKEFFSKVVQQQQKPKNVFTAFCEIIQYDDSLGHLFKQAGGLSYFFGLESGSKQILTNLGKTYTPKEAEGVINSAKHQGIQVVSSIMLPTIGDTYETIEETAQFLLRVKPDYCPILPTIPMADMMLDPEKYGYFLGDDFFTIFQLYSPKLHLPPQLGGDLPIKKGNWDWNTMKSISGTIASRLEEHGISTVISDETLLLAYLAREPANTFNKMFTTHLRNGDEESVKKYISKINTNISNPYI